MDLQTVPREFRRRNQFSWSEYLRRSCELAEALRGDKERPDYDRASRDFFQLFPNGKAETSLYGPWTTKGGAGSDLNEEHVRGVFEKYVCVTANFFVAYSSKANKTWPSSVGGLFIWILRCYREYLEERATKTSQRDDLFNGNFRSLAEPGGLVPGIRYRWTFFYVTRISMKLPWTRLSSEEKKGWSSFSAMGYDKLLYVGRTCDPKQRDSNRHNSHKRVLQPETADSSNRNIMGACNLLISNGLRPNNHWEWSTVTYSMAIVPEAGDIPDLIEDCLIWDTFIKTKTQETTLDLKHLPLHMGLLSMDDGVGGFWMGDQKINAGEYRNLKQLSVLPEDRQLVIAKREKNKTAMKVQQFMIRTANVPGYDIHFDKESVTDDYQNTAAKIHEYLEYKIPVPMRTNLSDLAKVEL